MSRQIKDISADTVQSSVVNSTTGFVMPTCAGNPNVLEIPGVNGAMIVDTAETDLWVYINGSWIYVEIDN